MDLWKDNLDVFRTQNPWWLSGKVPFALTGSVHRQYYDQVTEHLATQREVLLLEGPRRVGKTTIIYQAIAHLLETGTSPDHVLYLSVDDPYLKKETLFKDVQNYFEQFVAKANLQQSEETFYAFLDEVTVIEDWELYVKRYFDLKYPLRFVCTSSVAAFPKKGSRESLVGRISSVQVYPFCLSEASTLRAPAADDKGTKSAQAYAALREAWAGFYRGLDAPHLHSVLQEVETEFGPVLADDLPLRLYLLEGGFPEYILAQAQRYKERYFLENVVERTLFHDIGPVFGATDLHLMQRLFLYANNQNGSLLSAAEAARNLGAAYATVVSYLKSLSSAGLLYLISKYAASVEAEARSLDRTYAIDPGLYLSLARTDPASLDRSGAWGRLAETCVLAEIKRHEIRDIRYWRDRDREVDFVLEVSGALVAIEVKYREGALDMRGLRGFEQFSRRFSPQARIVVSKNVHELRDDGTLVVPLRLFLG